MWIEVSPNWQTRHFQTCALAQLLVVLGFMPISACRKGNILYQNSPKGFRRRAPQGLNYTDDSVAFFIYSFSVRSRVSRIIRFQSTTGAKRTLLYGNWCRLVLVLKITATLRKRISRTSSILLQGNCRGLNLPDTINRTTAWGLLQPSLLLFLFFLFSFSHSPLHL